MVGDIISINGSGTTVYPVTGLSTGVKYNFRIKAFDGAGIQSENYILLTTNTRDTRKPSDVTSVTADECDGVSNCTNPDNKGYEIKLVWPAASDLGTGVTGYKVYRRTNAYSLDPSAYTLVGYSDVDPPENDAAPAQYTYYDNNANAAAAYTDTIDDVAGVQIKAASGTTNNLIDYHHYYYRITVLDGAGNESYLTIDDMAQEISTNKADAMTPDVGNPTDPANVTAAAVGLDPSGNAQQINVSWNPSNDTGSGVIGYRLKRAITTYVEGACTTPAGSGSYSDLATTANTIYENNGLDEFSCYWYAVQAVDGSRDPSNISEPLNNTSSWAYQTQTPRTGSNQVPSSPTSVTVHATKGSPATDANVGHQITVMFSGAKIKYPANKITGYEVYRSTDPNLPIPIGLIRLKQPNLMYRPLQVLT